MIVDTNMLICGYAPGDGGAKAQKGSWRRMAGQLFTAAVAATGCIGTGDGSTSGRLCFWRCSKKRPPSVLALVCCKLTRHACQGAENHPRSHDVKRPCYKRALPHRVWYLSKKIDYGKKGKLVEEVSRSGQASREKLTFKHGKVSIGFSERAGCKTQLAWKASERED